MKISVLIAAYRAGPYIGKALESVRLQKHADWEVIVVEDGSRDETESLVRTFAASVSQPVRYDNLGENRGVATARNRLMTLAQGDALSFLDADDWWTPEHLSSAQASLESGADIAIARIQLVELPSQQLLETHVPAEIFFHEPIRELFIKSHVMTSTSVTLRRAITARAGEFDAAFRIGEDRDYWLRCALAGARFADTGHVTAFYAKHASSTMAKTLLWAQQEAAFYEKHRSLDAIPPKLRRSLLAHAFANHGRLLRASDPRASARLLQQAWALQPANFRFAPLLLFSLIKSVRA
jgi:glycosyltransferase involved in cell wall biosynthesis